MGPMDDSGTALMILTVKGYELSFTKYFYKPVQLRSIADITADIRDIEKSTDGLLNEILGR